MRGDWQILVGRFGSKLNDVGTLAEQREGLLCSPDRHGKDVRKHDALEAHSADDLRDMEHAAAKFNLWRFLNVENSFEAERHNAPAPSGGNSATFVVAPLFLSLRLTQVNAHDLTIDSTGMVA